MTLKELVQNHTWQNVFAKFLEIYPEAKENMKGYELVFERLKKMQPEENDFAIIITKETDEDDDYFEVSGLHKHPKTKEETYPQGIEFTPWRQWLGMDIYQDSLDNFSEQEIVVHCLYEMTFVGFSEDEIQKVLKR